ncbi:MAG: hypothetical protein EOO20_13220 [Chryseobacterium sp.]|nr:MAG: hypothetical protein EOO20_13220 [Chryseobacterium sp.]
MAKSENNEVMFGARGKVGNLVVFKNFGNNQTVISKRPRRPENPVYTAKQIEVKQKFREAVVYAKGVIGNPDLATIYQPFAKPGKSVYNLALANYCKAPQIILIDTANYQGQIGEQIRVRAIDNFKVTEVRVSVYDAADVLLESGLAILSANNIDWIYDATTLRSTLAGTKITAEAKDTPGNTTLETVAI